MRIKLFVATILLCCLSAGVRAQDKESYGGIPADVYFLMPEFGQGVVWFSDRAPAQGKLNICSENDSLWFLDEKGEKLVASDIKTVTKVEIADAVFVYNNGQFYRIYPVKDDVAVAVRRELKILRGAKQGAYGGYSQTSSIREYTAVHTENGTFNLDNTSRHPYEVSESYYLYKGGHISSLKNKNLRRNFPDRKADLDEYFGALRFVPTELPEIQAFLLKLATGAEL